MPAQALLTCQHLSRFYPPLTWALKDASLELFPGDSLAITGASGSGKSTLLGLIGLLDSPTSGSLYLAGQEVSKASEKERTRARAQHISFVFQGFHLVQHLTAWENVTYALEMRGRPSRQARKDAAQALEEVGLSHRLNSLPSSLSGGEQQRVAVARALASKSSLILCDEPTGNLDSSNSHKILDLLLAQEDRALVIVTHEDDIARRCQGQMIMVDGQLTC